jgi:hypothetical protein
MIRPLGGGFCPTEMRDEKQHRRMIAEAANAALRGESHNTGRFTAPPGGSFVLENPRLGVGRVLLLTPRNDAAAMARWYAGEEKSGAVTIIFNPPLLEAAEFSFAVAGVGM